MAISLKTFKTSARSSGSLNMAWASIPKRSSAPSKERSANIKRVSLSLKIDTKKHTLFSAIEALRFMGAIMVVLFHLNIYPSGYKGVDLFFVISGFVLYYRYGRSNNRQELRPYFVHRISKIYLLYWTALVLTLLLDPSIEWQGFWKTFFLFPGHHETLSVSWSLSYELYFYALFSIFLFIRSPAHRHTLLFSLLIVTSTITAVALAGPAIKGSVINFMLGHNT